MPLLPKGRQSEMPEGGWLAGWPRQLARISKPTYT
ncbi:hypothetical protein JMJ77_0013038 [Colletotrichum scovillei]|uniref:Uncharacterized protein n=1 Tax=Colletotrichum scovillei TaxID=1209932 RepID=A0A9P7UCN9_9PEZI|nr:hypothetical protein JMJ77_0013038 [Colletotrichum scovillei]KAG7069326.1 hypothetical protein JMJ76_0002999 [Colletotrichum scovillei]KAG7073276.1 hypothetical protein JMJ78_0014255 [Colletotrichum scovillei]